LQVRSVEVYGLSFANIARFLCDLCGQKLLTAESPENSLSTRRKRTREY